MDRDKGKIEFNTTQECNVLDGEDSFADASYYQDLYQRNGILRTLSWEEICGSD
ncbi:MAG: hypothetical protein GY915_08610 [bacterium]|nr:hypothetical protein [bacterium]